MRTSQRAELMFTRFLHVRGELNRHRREEIADRVNVNFVKIVIGQLYTKFLRIFGLVLRS